MASERFDETFIGGRNSLNHIKDHLNYFQKKINF